MSCTTPATIIIFSGFRMKYYKQSIIIVPCLKFMFGSVAWALLCLVFII